MSEADQPSPRRGASLVGAGILASRLAGLVRERVIAAELGVGLTVDAFRAALRIPNLLQNLLGEGVLSASFVPVYSRLLAEGDEEEAGRVAGAVAGLLAVLAAVLVVVGVVLARPLTAVLAPGFSGQRYELTVTLVRILTPGVGLLVLSAWCLGVLNSHRRFFLSYVAPVLWNVAQIAVLVGLGLRGASATTLVTGLAVGAVIGAGAQVAVQAPTVRSLVPNLRLSLRTDLAGVRDAARRLGPVVAGRGVVQISAYVDLVLASLLTVGAVSALGYAQVLYLLPVSLFGMSVAAAELPELSRLGPITAGATTTWRTRVDDGLGRIAFFVGGVSVAYLVVGDLVVGTILGVGAFGDEEQRLVWLVLAALTLGLLATTASRLIQSTLYALGDTTTPARVAAIRVAASAVVGVVLMFQLDRFGVDGVVGSGDLRLGAVGLGLASGITAWVELVLLRRRAQRAIGPVRLAGGHVLGLAAAGLGAVVVALGARLAIRGLDLPDVVALVIAGAPAALVYVAVAARLGMPEARHLVSFGRR